MVDLSCAKEYLGLLFYGINPYLDNPEEGGNRGLAAKGPGFTALGVRRAPNTKVQSKIA